MSGIAGIIHHDTRPVAVEELQSMASLLARRGPDGRLVWYDNSVGLLNCLLRSDDQHGPQLFVDEASKMVITGDCRLDNSAELQQIFSCPETEKVTPADIFLLMKAYQKWGKACLPRIKGDFAFALWDPHEMQLFCGRDHLGIRPFYYYQSDSTFVFGSEILPIARLLRHRLHINETRIFDYLVHYCSEGESTFLEEIKRLPARHSCLVKNGKVVIQRYWDFDAEKELVLSSDKEYAEAFLEKFALAVRRRLPRRSTVGALLSGGLDSTSICSVAGTALGEEGRGPLRTFSQVFSGLPAKQQARIDERFYMAEAIAMLGLAADYISFQADGPLRGTMQYADCGPMPYFNGYLLEKTCRRIREKGVKIVLDGTDGDTCVSHGYERLYHLGGRLNLVGVLNQIRSYCRLRNQAVPKVSKIIRRYVVRPALKSLLSPRMAYHFGLLFDESATMMVAALRPDFARRHDLFKQAGKKAAGLGRHGRAAHYQDITDPLQQYVLEFVDPIPASFQLEFRYPFWDRDLLEFCLAVPLEQKMDEGVTRRIQRRAMQGLIPPAIAGRYTKADLSFQFLKDFAITGEQELSCLWSKESQINSYLQVDHLQKWWQQVARDPYNNHAAAMNLFLALSLEKWLSNPF